jgi:hypothetical protein
MKRESSECWSHMAYRLIQKLVELARRIVEVDPKQKGEAETIVKDLNVKICFMSAGEINRDALREIHPSISLGCFIIKPVTNDYLINRIMSELD